MPNYVYGSESDFDLYHYGVLGMKWGIRKYQKKDGSLTSEGVKRYRKAKADYKEAKANNVSKDVRKDHKKNVKYYKKELKKDLKADKAQAYFDKHGRIPSQNELAFKGGLIGAFVAGIPGAFIGSSLGAKKASDLQDGLFRSHHPKQLMDSVSNETVDKLTKKVSDQHEAYKKERYERAKSHDKFDMYFAEVMSSRSNGPQDDTSEKWLKEYKQYLDDPEKWLNKKN